MESTGESKTHSHAVVPPGTAMKDSPPSGNGQAQGGVAQPSGTGSGNGNGVVPGRDNALGSVQLSYGSVGGGHPSTNATSSSATVDLNGETGGVGNGSTTMGSGAGTGASGRNNPTGNHGMEFGFGFSHAWGAPNVAGMHQGSPGYQLHQTQTLLNPSAISAQPPHDGNGEVPPDQASLIPSATTGNSPNVDNSNASHTQTGASGEPGSTGSSIHGAPGAPPPPPPHVTGPGVVAAPHNHFSMPEALPVDPLETILGPFPCARLRGLPFEASIQDVLLFFHGLLVLDVVVAGRQDGSGRGIGEAFVLFAPVDFQIALQHNRQNMGRRYIEVFPAKRSEYYTAILSQLQMHGHPNGNNLGDGNSNLGSLFSSGMWGEKSLGVTQANVMMQHLHLGHHHHHPNPYFPHHQHQHHHPGHRHGGRYYDGRSGNGRGPGGRGGRFMNSRGSGPQWQNGHMNGIGGNPALGGPGTNPVPPAERDHTGFLRMRGLPFSATKENVLEFFKDYSPEKDSIVFSYRTDGRATGEAYVQLSGPETSKAAMTSLNRNMMGSRYIELFVSSKEEHRRMMNRSASR